MDNEIKITKLSKDEAGKLHGGFSIQSTVIKTDFFANNGNCTAGGWFDTNTNCTGECRGCPISPSTGTDTGTSDRQ